MYNVNISWKPFILCPVIYPIRALRGNSRATFEKVHSETIKTTHTSHSFLHARIPLQSRLYTYYICKLMFSASCERVGEAARCSQSGIDWESAGLSRASTLRCALPTNHPPTRPAGRPPLPRAPRDPMSRPQTMSSSTLHHRPLCSRNAPGVLSPCLPTPKRRHSPNSRRRVQSRRSPLFLHPALYLLFCGGVIISRRGRDRAWEIVPEKAFYLPNLRFSGDKGFRIVGRNRFMATMNRFCELRNIY